MLRSGSNNSCRRTVRADSVDWNRLFRAPARQGSAAVGTLRFAHPTTVIHIITDKVRSLTSSITDKFVSSLRSVIDAAPAGITPWQVPARARWRCAWHEVQARGSERVAAQKAGEGHPAAGPETVVLDRLIGILRAAWQVAAVVTDERRQRQPIGREECARQILGDACASRRAQFRCCI